MIGRRCRRGDAQSRAILIARDLSAAPRAPQQRKRETRKAKRENAAARRKAAGAARPEGPAGGSCSESRTKGRALLPTPPPWGGLRCPIFAAHAAGPSRQRERNGNRRKRRQRLKRTRTDGRHGRRKRIKAAMASGIHLFPFRTEKLSLTAPMVLRKWESRPPPPWAGREIARPYFY